MGAAAPSRVAEAQISRMDTNNFFLGSYDRDPWSEQRCAHRRSDTISSDGGTNDKDG